jgi:uncharacterized protein YjbI with pentapeptide repeats
LRVLARAQTLTTLGQLDSHRKRSLLQFLHEANLITKNQPVVNLIGADMSGADLYESNITNDQLVSSRSLEGATMPDGSKHD